MIYLDHAATTQLRPEALEAMLPFLAEEYGNPSSVYTAARSVRRAVEEARRRIAETLRAQPGEIYFTSGGTESDNWALIAAFETAVSEGRGRHIVSTEIEHPAILRSLEYLREMRGAEVTLLPVDTEGNINPDTAEAALRPDTCLLSVMAANNEIGTVQPVHELAELAASRGILFHTDAVQAYGHTDLNVKDLGIDMLSASGHKFGGPKGVGFLYVRSSVRLRALLHGGAQERQRRAGTENAPAIVGMGKAAELALHRRAAEEEKTRQFRDQLWHRLSEAIPDIRINGGMQRRLSNNLNVCIPGLEAESALILLDQAGIAASAGSACASGALEPSHVLRAIGLSEAAARASLRFTVGTEHTEEEIDRAADCIAGVAARLRAHML